MTTEAETVQLIEEGIPLMGASIYIFPWYINKMAKRQHKDGWTVFLNSDAKAIELMQDVVEGFGRNWDKIKGMPAFQTLRWMLSTTSLTEPCYMRSFYNPIRK